MLSIKGESMKTESAFKLKIELVLTATTLATAIIMGGFLYKPYYSVSTILSDVAYYYYLSPFFVMYIASWPLIFFHEGTKILVWPKISGFLMVYLSYLSFYFYVLVANAGVGVQIGLIFIPVSIPILLPILYAVGKAIGSVVFSDKSEKSE